MTPAFSGLPFERLIPPPCRQCQCQTGCPTEEIQPPNPPNHYHWLFPTNHRTPVLFAGLNDMEGWIQGSNKEWAKFEKRMMHTSIIGFLCGLRFPSTLQREKGSDMNNLVKDASMDPIKEALKRRLLFFLLS
ncbi:unnamed protein product [Lactuca virosa]|uniref:Uncharacterized protein n=1 Tax=Lactuca virosa TaxID=75947 RepID=A0AAU9LT98_9ASTR|nr:unnamed protein product [Lactuca virosa]